MKQDKFVPLPMRLRGDLPKLTYVYKQDPNYAETRSREKLVFWELLERLLSSLPACRPILKRGRGKPQTLLKDALFCCIAKAYETKSSYRIGGDLIIASEHQYLSRVPHVTTLNLQMRSKRITPLLHEIIGLTALSIREQVYHAAIDASGYQQRSLRHGYK